MQILVVGHGSQLEELKSKFGQRHTYLLAVEESAIERYLTNADAVFDFVPSPFTLKRYTKFIGPVFVNCVFTSLSALISLDNIEKRDFIFGFFGLPTFFNRPVLEVAAASQHGEARLKQICIQLETDFVCVEDRIGGVTPRVITMIINEAYYTLEEGTANRNDIDLAMKLGTNYPFGPFEWAQRIGIGNLVNLLDALYQDTKDERYIVCDLLRREAKT
jgi:3-hydroxybutyryl-CoA dehydrogenase